MYNQMGLKMFVDAIKGTTKKLLLMILQKVLKNKISLRGGLLIFFLFVLDAVDSIVKKVNPILTEIKLESS